MFRFTSPPRTDFSVSNTPNNRSYKTFVRSLFTFYFRQCFTVSFKFSSSLLFYFLSQFNNFFRFMKMKILGNFQSVFTSMVDTYPNCKDVQSAIGQGQKRGYYNHRNILLLAHGLPPILYSEN